MTNQKKFKPSKPKNPKHKAQNQVDAQCLTMKPVARTKTENTIGAAVSLAAKTYDRGQQVMPIEDQQQLDNSDRDNEGDPGDPPEVDISTPDGTGESYAFGLNNGFYQKTGAWSNADTHCKDWKEPCNCSGVLCTFNVLDLMCPVENVFMFS
ncbi:hypothetical protein DFH28DRAFT_1081847 [Melampsora americana]|nr:hypothetical protein DFH28DRAFT_1081847 [Melampsora americana]